MGTPASGDYTGHELDTQTQLHCAGARYYMSALGRWMATDPILGEQGATALLEQDRRLLTMSSYNYAFNSPTNLTDPTGMAPMDWFRDSDGEIKYDENVKSQADLGEGQTYLGESVLVKDGDNTEFLSADGSRGFVFDSNSVTGAEENSLVTSGLSAAAQKQGAALKFAGEGGSALSILRAVTEVAAKGTAVASLGLTIGSEAALESDPLGAYEGVKIATSGALTAGSFVPSIGLGVAAGAFLLEVTGGKEKMDRAITIKILETQADYVEE